MLNQTSPHRQLNSCFKAKIIYSSIITHCKLVDILYKVVDFLFKGGISDYIVIHKQVCAS